MLDAKVCLCCLQNIHLYSANSIDFFVEKSYYIVDKIPILSATQKSRIKKGTGSGGYSRPLLVLFEKRREMATIIGMGDIVREKRKSLLMSQTQLAEKIGVCKRTIIDIETNIGNPKFDVLFRLFRELNIPLDQIFYPDVPENFDDKSMLMQELMGCSEKEIAVILPLVINMKQTLRDKNKKKKQRKAEWK